MDSEPIKAITSIIPKINEYLSAKGAAFYTLNQENLLNINKLLCSLDTRICYLIVDQIFLFNCKVK
jgi:hypothetical protein